MIGLFDVAGFLAGFVAMGLALYVVDPLGKFRPKRGNGSDKDNDR